MKKFILLMALIFTHQVMAVCSSPIARDNVGVGQVLKSSTLNLDFNTVYSRVNNLPGDCLIDASVTTAKIANGSITAEKLAAAVVAKFLPVGLINSFGGNTAPDGWLFCHGQTVSRTTYADLFAVIGTSFGAGNGSTTFHLPDLRGRFLRGVDMGQGRDPNRAARTAMNTGGNAGDLIGSVQDDELKTHKHTSLVASSRDGDPDGGGDTNAASGYWRSATGYYDTTNTGGDETRPKNANVQFIIKY